mmetsp:Transcript_29611/g.95170  ORF Transcript_29611/g.95170 Transcript_29611/m.95170 type:complete len:227 (-) Transcript_29611:218-898(-)
MRLTRVLPGSGASNPCRLAAASAPSLTPSMSVTSAMRPRSALACNVSPHASRSSRIRWRVVGTSSLRSRSSAACTDQASRAGSGSSARMCPGDGPTVETQTYERPSWKPKGWTIACSARETSSTLSAGSPMPMNTTFLSGGMPCCRTAAAAACSCARISSAARERSRPIVPVAQKVQPCRQPTCEETHSVENAPCGMMTASTSSPRRSRRSSLRVPHAETVDVRSE